MDDASERAETARTISRLIDRRPMAQPASRQTTTADESAALDPTGQLWWHHMLAGDFEAAWQINDARRLAAVPDPHRMWNGSPIDGRHLILRCLHGLGDAIQLLRYVPLIRARAASLTVEVPPGLLELAHYLPGVDRVITWGEHAPATPPAWDLQLEINELPYLFRTTLGTIPPPLHLHLPESARTRARQLLSPMPTPRIGLAWESAAWNPERSIPLALLAPLFTLPATFVSLQLPVAEAANAALLAAHHIRTASQAGPGLVSLAAVIAELDLVLTVDTLAAHLAATLHRPTCLLLQHEADWRWLSTRTDSPWYPTLRLYRQPTPQTDDLTTQPTSPTTQPANHATQPANPATQPVDATTQPAAPAADSTQQSAWTPVLDRLRADLNAWISSP